MVTQSNQAARGNTLQIPPYSIYLLQDEKVVRLIRRSRVLLIGRLLLLVLLLVLVLVVALYGSISWPIAIGASVIALALLVLIWRPRVFHYGPVLLLVLVLTVALYGPISWPTALYGPISESRAIGAGVIVLVLLVWMVSICIYYWYNIWLLTSHRIIEIKRSHLLIREKRTETEYDNIREIRVDITTLFGRLFRIGTVDIEMLSNTSSDIRLSDVDRPLDIQDEIYELRDQFEQEEYGQNGIEQRLVKDLLAAIATLTKTGP